MNNNHQALWDDCLRLIRANVTEQQFKTWFAPIVFESYSEAQHTLLLQLPSMYVFEYLEQHYVGLLSKVLARVFGTSVKLNYRIVEVKAQQGQGRDITTDVESEGPSIETVPVRQNINKSPSMLDAIGLKCCETYPQKRVLYVSARLFQVQFTDSVRQNTTNDFINFYQSIDLLIVDDIQEWVNSPKTLDTFFHIFDHLFRMGKQIILASDRPPVDLQGVKDRLLTRFACGLIAELEKPNPQLCVDILSAKCKRDGLKIPADVIEFIAQTANGSVRDLEGVVNSLMAYSIVYNSNIDMKLAERVIKRAVKVDNHPLTIDDIVEKVCKHYGVNQQNVFSKSRKRDFVQARQIAMYLAQKHTKMPASRIGQLIGGRDHSTVIHSCNTIEKRLKIDKMFVAELSSIENSFKLKK